MIRTFVAALATLNHTVNPSLTKNLPWHPTNDFAGRSTPAEVDAFLKSETARWATLVRDAKIEAQ